MLTKHLLMLHTYCIFLRCFFFFFFWSEGLLWFEKQFIFIFLKFICCCCCAVINLSGGIRSSYSYGGIFPYESWSLTATAHLKGTFEIALEMHMPQICDPVISAYHLMYICSPDVHRKTQELKKIIMFRQKVNRKIHMKP